MGLAATAFVTVEEYLAFEREAESKHEYWKGKIHAMSGGSPPHSLLAVKLGGMLDRQVSTKGCLVFNADMRVRTSPTGLYTYPDISVVCGKPKYAESRRDVLTNPVLIAEITSPSTERYDRVGKFSLYEDIASLREYLLFSSTEVFVEHYWRRPGEQWKSTEARRLKDSLKLASVPATIRLKDLYGKIEF